MSKQSDMSLTMAEIHKIDPSFDKEMFINECKTDIIPTILEAFLQGKVDILKDWCHEAVSLCVPTRVLVYHCGYMFLDVVQCECECSVLLIVTLLFC